MDEARFMSSSDSSLEERPEVNMTINELYLDAKTDMVSNSNNLIYIFTGRLEFYQCNRESPNPISYKTYMVYK